MKIIELYYSSEVPSFNKAKKKLMMYSKNKEGVIAIAKDVEDDAVIKKARKRGVPKLPTAIINGNKAITGSRDVHKKIEKMARS